MAYLDKELAKRRRRNFNGANVSRLTNSWGVFTTPPDKDISTNLRALRARSRDLAKNNDYVRHFLRMVQTNVVGPSGIVLQAKSIDPNGGVDRLANEAIELAWKEWGERGSCDVTGRHSWWSLQRLFIQTVAADGEILIVVDRGDNQNNSGFTLQFTDPELLDVDFTERMTNGNQVTMGIEYNKKFRPVAYHLKNMVRTDDYDTFQGVKHRRILSKNVIHSFLPDAVLQSRGVPWLSTSMFRLNMLGGYEEAEVTASRVAASSMGFFEQDPEVAGVDGGFKTGETDTDGNYIDDAEPGTFRNLPPGVKLAEWNPDHPNSAYRDFMKTALRGVASGLGVSYNSLSNDLESVSFSSIRQGAIEERETWKCLQKWMVEVFNDVVYKEWLENALLRGVIKVQGQSLDITKIEKYKNISWQGKRWPWVDPLKDSKANDQDTNMMARSVSDVIRERGEDPEDVFQEIKRERERWKQLGIEPVTIEQSFNQGNSDE